MEWDFLKSFISEHVNNDQGLANLALAINGLIIFPLVIGYVKMTMIDFFEQVQNYTNPSSTILQKPSGY